jgi:hypothetical protein
MARLSLPSLEYYCQNRQKFKSAWLISKIRRSHIERFALETICFETVELATHFAAATSLFRKRLWTIRVTAKPKSWRKLVLYSNSTSEFPLFLLPILVAVNYRKRRSANITVLVAHTFMRILLVV